MEEDDEQRAPLHLYVLGPIAGGLVAFIVVVVSQSVGILGAAIYAGLGSILGWGLQGLFLRRNKGVPATLSLLALLGGILVWATFPAAKDTQIPSSNSPDVASTSGSGIEAASDSPEVVVAPLVIPDTTMSFRAMPSDEVPDDLDGLIGIARTTYGDPQRLSIKHMLYDSTPDGGSSPVVTAFTGETAIALAEQEWEWFAAGNSGDRHTEAVEAGDVHCAFHDQDNGTTRAECWRWDSRLAVVVDAISFPSDAGRYVAPAIEDLFSLVSQSY